MRLISFRARDRTRDDAIRRGTPNYENGNRFRNEPPYVAISARFFVLYDAAREIRNQREERSWDTLPRSGSFNTKDEREREREGNIEKFDLQMLLSRCV